jgi:4-amino-4-deoxy-L-arabinose transferase-like glycosyltransferase
MGIVPQSGRGWIPVAALLLLALTVRVGFVAATSDYRPVKDGRDYDRYALSIAHGDGYPRSGPERRPTAYRPPGYPFFLGGVYALAGETEDRWAAARLVQAGLGTIAVLLIGLIAAQLWGRREALVALAIGAVFPPLVIVGEALMSESLALPLVLGAVAAVLRQRGAPGVRWAVVAGVLLGLATLTRPNCLLLALPLAFAVAAPHPRLNRRGLAPVAALFAAAALAIAPWSVRNALAMDHFVPVTTEVGNTLAGTYNDVSRTDPDFPGAWREPSRVRDFAPLYARRSELSEPAFDRELRSAAADYVAERPLYVAEVGYRNAWRLTGLDGDWARLSASFLGVEAGPAHAARFAFFALALLALVGALTPAARRAPLFLWTIPVLLVLSALFLNGETPRFRVLADPFAILLAAVGCVHVVDRLRGRIRRSEGEVDRAQDRRQAVAAH